MFELPLKSMLIYNFVLWALVIAIFITGIECNNIDREHRTSLRSNGLIFYDLKTNRTLLPPIVTPLKYTQSSRLPLIGRPCSCQTLNCGCCAGMSIQQFNFNQHLCTNFTYDPNAFSIQMDVMMNENSLYSNMVSAKNPPPLCIPVPLPYIPLSTEMCVKMFNIFTPGRNLHMCMDMQMKVQKAPIIVLHFDCMRMGQDGLALVKPDQNGGLGVTGSPESPPQVEVPEETVPNPETGPEETVPNQETVPQTQPMAPTAIEPPQTDYDIYDEVDQDKMHN